jgi:hypothetical protein
MLCYKQLCVCCGLVTLWLVNKIRQPSNAIIMVRTQDGRRYSIRRGSRRPCGCTWTSVPDVVPFHVTSSRGVSVRIHETKRNDLRSGKIITYRNSFSASINQYHVFYRWHKWLFIRKSGNPNSVHCNKHILEDV